MEVQFQVTARTNLATKALNSHHSCFREVSSLVITPAGTILSGIFFLKPFLTSINLFPHEYENSCAGVYFSSIVQKPLKEFRN